MVSSYLDVIYSTEDAWPRGLTLVRRTDRLDQSRSTYGSSEETPVRENSHGLRQYGMTCHL